MNPALSASAAASTALDVDVKERVNFLWSAAQTALQSRHETLANYLLYVVIFQNSPYYCLFASPAARLNVAYLSNQELSTSPLPYCLTLVFQKHSLEVVCISGHWYAIGLGQRQIRSFYKVLTSPVHRVRLRHRHMSKMLKSTYSWAYVQG